MVIVEEILPPGRSILPKRL